MYLPVNLFQQLIDLKVYVTVLPVTQVGLFDLIVKVLSIVFNRFVAMNSNRGIYKI
jgi:hypothetical protein